MGSSLLPIAPGGIIAYGGNNNKARYEISLIGPRMLGSLFGRPGMPAALPLGLRSANAPGIPVMTSNIMPISSDTAVVSPGIATLSPGFPAPVDYRGEIMSEMMEEDRRSRK